MGVEQTPYIYGNDIGIQLSESLILLRIKVKTLAEDLTINV